MAKQKSARRQEEIRGFLSNHLTHANLSISYLSADLCLTAAARNFAWIICMMNEVSRISFRRHIRNSPFAMLNKNLRDFVSSSKEPRTSGATCSASSSSSKPKQHYLHLAPDGDYWTGSEIFAAKHLQPDYVRSVPIPPPKDFDVEKWLDETFGDDEKKQTEALQKIYDERKLPSGVGHD